MSPKAPDTMDFKISDSVIMTYTANLPYGTHSMCIKNSYGGVCCLCLVSVAEFKAALSGIIAACETTLREIEKDDTVQD